MCTNVQQQSAPQCTLCDLPTLEEASPTAAASALSGDHLPQGGYHVPGANKICHGDVSWRHHSFGDGVDMAASANGGITKILEVSPWMVGAISMGYPISWNQHFIRMILFVSISKMMIPNGLPHHILLDGSGPSDGSGYLWTTLTACRTPWSWSRVSSFQDGAGTFAKNEGYLGPVKDVELRRGSCCNNYLGDK